MAGYIPRRFTCP